MKNKILSKIATMGFKYYDQVLNYVGGYGGVYKEIDYEDYLVLSENNKLAVEDVTDIICEYLGISNA